MRIINGIIKIKNKPTDNAAATAKPSFSTKKKILSIIKSL